MANKYIPARGNGAKTTIGAMGDSAKGTIVFKNGKVVKSTVDTSKDKDAPKGKHRKED